MSNMARTTSNNPMKGFSVLQPSLGAPLSWMPAVGTKELEQLINAYLPGPASAQEKRATISMDFFEFAAQTGENFKYYPVQINAPQPTRSPASSAVSPSPAMSTMSYGSSSQPSTPAPRTASRTSAAKAEKTDYSHLPGMKILTTDGHDVTNSVSRGCKSKEQREHAHLMRVLKACDACKKKKIRCDPSHKRRSSSQVSTKAVSKPAKKVKKAPSSSASQAAPAALTPSPETSFQLDLNMSLDMDFDSFPSMDIDDILAFNPEPIDEHIPQDFYGAVPQDFDFFLNNELSPANASSTDSFDSPAQPLTPVGSGLFSQGDFTAFNDTNSLAFLQAGGQEPSLPYMTPGAHGSNYVDFSLYSPASSFIDEEPQKLKAGEKSQDPVLQAKPASPKSQLGEAHNSPAGLDEARPSTGLAEDQQLRFDRSESTAFNPQEPQSQAPGDRLQPELIVGDEQIGGVISHGDPRPYHGDNGGHDSGRISSGARLHGLQQDQQAMRRNSPLTTAVPQADLERTNLFTRGSLSPLSPASSPVSPQVSPQFAGQDEFLVGGGASALSRTVSPSELQVDASNLRTPLARSPISAHALQSTVSSTTAVNSTGRSSGLDGGLTTNCGVVVNNSGLPVNCGLLPTGDLHSLVLNGQYSTAAVAPVHEIGSSSAALLRSEGNGRSSGINSATTTATSTSGLGLLSHGHQRQVLHGMTSNAANSSCLRRPFATCAESGVAPLSSLVHQLPGHPRISSVLLIQVAVFGLVSMLLIMGLTSLLQLQSPIIAHLPSSSLIFLSCLSILSPMQGALDSVGSIRRRQDTSGRRSGLPAIAVPLACF